MLARSVVRRHLKANLRKTQPSVRIENFQSPLDSHFQGYLETTGIYFVMCHDGANPTPLSKEVLAVGQNARITDIKAKESRRKSIFRSFINKLINRGYNVALINGVEFSDTKVRLCILVELLQDISIC